MFRIRQFITPIRAIGIAAMTSMPIGYRVVYNEEPTNHDRKRVPSQKKPTVKLMHGLGASNIEVGGQQFPVVMRFDNLTLFACGRVCRRSWWGRYEILSAVLYIPENFSAPDILTLDIARTIEVCYLQDMRQHEFIDIVHNACRQNGPFSEEIAGILEQYANSYVDTSAGDRYRIDYLPNQGVSLRYRTKSEKNFRVLATFPGGVEVADAIFSSWFGEYPMCATTKKELLTDIYS